jgi:CubicO group peptidase (beta-lactamase class C family)
MGPHGAILSEKSFRKMVFPMVEDEGEAYSYGLYLFEDEGYRHAGHGGDVPGYESYLWLDLDNGLGTVVLMSQPYNKRASFIALEFLREAYLGHNIPDPPPLPDFTHISSPHRVCRDVP